MVKKAALNIERVIADTTSAGMQEGIQYGMQDFIDRRGSRFRNLQEYISGNLDARKIQKVAQYETNKFFTSRGATTKKITEADLYRLKEAITKKVANGVSSGNYLNNSAKAAILNNHSLDGGKLYSFLHPVATLKRKLNRTPDYTGRALDAFSDIYEFMEKGGYGETVPEGIRKKVETMKELGFYDVMLNVLGDKGIIKGRHELYGKDMLRKKANTTSKEVIYEMNQRLAAPAIISFFLGIFLLAFSQANLTGFAIGSRLVEVTTTFILGFIFLVLGAVLLLIVLSKHRHILAKQASISVKSSKPVKKQAKKKKKSRR